jgi:hypothetical protein
MSHQYDLFEKFPDGSSLWRACVLGFQSACLQLRDLSARSQNQFYAINVVSGKTIFPDLHRRGFAANPEIGKRNRMPAA